MPGLNTSNIVWTVPGSLGATVYVVANDAPAAIKNWATILQGAGYPVWVCDNTNDDVEIAAAITYLASTGGCISLSAGTFTLSDNVDFINTSNIWVRGEGRGNTVVTLANNINNDIFQITGTGSDITFSSFTIDGNKANQTGGSALNNNSATSSRVSLIDMDIKNTKGVAVIFSGTYASVTDCYFTSDEAGAVLFNTNSIGGRVSGCYFNDNGNNDGVEGAVRVVSSTGHTVTGNTFLANCQGLEMVGGSRNNISSNIFINQVRYGLLLSGGTNDANTLNGNIIVSPSTGSAGIYDGIYITGTGNVITGNNILGIANTMNAGIREDATTYTTNSNIITENVFGTGVNNPYVSVNSAGANSKVWCNIGWVTEASGSSTVLNGTGYAVVTHGLSITPVAGKINVIPTAPLGSATYIYLNNLNSTAFTVNFNADAGTNVDFGWSYTN